MPATEGLNRDTLAALLLAADPAAVLVPPRILRRVIKRGCAITSTGLQVPHRKCFVLARDTLLHIASREELRMPAQRTLPPTLILLAEMDPGRLASFAPADALRRYWKLLFHAHVHDELSRLCQEGKLTELFVRKAVERIGRVDYEAALRVLGQENMLLPPLSEVAKFQEFLAVYLELSGFEPVRLTQYFPLLKLENVEEVAKVLLDARHLLTSTRPAGAADAVAEIKDAAEVVHAQTIHELILDSGASPSESVARAISRARSHGNLIRAALACFQNSDAGYLRDLDQLLERLRNALDLPSDEASVWREALSALLPLAATGFWNVERRLLYDLQNICLDAEREVYAVDLVEWIGTWGRRPLRRHLPHQQLLLVVRHLRRAAHRLSAARLPIAVRGPYQFLLQGTVRRMELRLRDQFRPSVRAALDEVELIGNTLVERVAREKIVEELLDRVVERGILTLGDIRDAVARNRVKLDDLSGPEEFIMGDRLLELDRHLSTRLDGVYRWGEGYLRWLQRASSLAFGTMFGRALTLFLFLPFGGALLIVEGAKHAVEMFVPHHHDGESTPEHQSIFLRFDSIAVIAIGFFLLALIHIASFRGRCWNLLELLYRGVRLVVADIPKLVASLPLVRGVLQSKTYLLIYLYVLRPLVYALPFALIAYYRDGPEWAWRVGGAAFLLLVFAFNSRLGSVLEELFTDRVARTWELFRRDLLPGLVMFILQIFRQAVEGIDRLLYTVDEWLRFRSGDSKLMAAVKPVLGLLWFAISYLIRIVINLFIEPTFNPVKHFPVVTVSAKLMLPFIVTLFEDTRHLLAPLVGMPVAVVVATTIQFFIPGFAGFVVWELKENWKLYRANQSKTLRRLSVGSHGETMVGLLRPGFHSGTIPKLYARLRHAEGEGVLQREEELHHVAVAVTRFVERELLQLLARSRLWGNGLRLRIGAVRFGTSRVRVEIRCQEFTEPSLVVDFDERAGWLEASIFRTGWAARLSNEQRTVFEHALAGLYHVAGVDLVREELSALLPGGVSVGVTAEKLEVTRGETADEVSYPLFAEDSASTRPAADWPTLTPSQLRWSLRPLAWDHWLAVWEGEKIGDDDLGTGLIPAIETRRKQSAVMG